MMPSRITFPCYQFQVGTLIDYQKGFHQEQHARDGDASCRSAIHGLNQATRLGEPAGRSGRAGQKP